MRRLAALSAILFAVVLVQASAAPVQVRYVANEGFLIEAGSAKLLIDAPFDDLDLISGVLRRPLGSFAIRRGRQGRQR